MKVTISTIDEFDRSARRDNVSDNYIKWLVSQAKK